jgi:hypothetical protein
VRQHPARGSTPGEIGSSGSPRSPGRGDPPLGLIVCAKRGRRGGGSGRRRSMTFLLGRAEDGVRPLARKRTAGWYSAGTARRWRRRPTTRPSNCGTCPAARTPPPSKGTPAGSSGSRSAGTAGRWRRRAKIRPSGCGTCRPVERRVPDNGRYARCREFHSACAVPPESPWRLRAEAAIDQEEEQLTLRSAFATMTPLGPLAKR